MGGLPSLCGSCFKQGVAPQPLFCEICFEEGKMRKCCGRVFCEYDYKKNKVCPNCNTAVDKVNGHAEEGGTVYLAQGFSEHEECRTCLDMGLKRRCCGNYYCDTCYCKYLIVFKLVLVVIFVLTYFLISCR